jgi:predicted nucleotidyltransferase
MPAPSLKQSGLKPAVIQQIQSTFSKFPEINTVILYGSRAMGTYKIGSDIDLTVALNTQYAPSITLLNKISIALDQLNLIYTFDISLLSDITNPKLIEHINQFGIIFYVSEDLKPG